MPVVTMIKTKLKPVKGKKTFDRIFETGKRFSYDEASAMICYREPAVEQNDVINYAVLVRKKVSKKAVVRNRIKRLLRESLRKILIESDESDLKNMFDYIVLSWNAAPEHPMRIHLKDVMPKVKSVLLKAYERNLKNSEGN